MDYDIKAIYEEYERQHQGAAERQGWTNLQMQQANYSAMHSMLSNVGLAEALPGLTLHDVGCGYGDYYAFLHQRHSPRKYIGTDINGHSIARALREHPQGDFRMFDMTTRSWPDFLTTDITLVFGAFSFHRPRVIERVLHEMWAHTKVALGFMCWWNLDKNYVYHEHSAQLQKVVNRFVRESAATVADRRVGDFAESTDALFLLLK